MTASKRPDGETGDLAAAEAYVEMHAEQALAHGDDPRDAVDALTDWMVQADPAAVRAAVRHVLATTPASRIAWHLIAVGMTRTRTHIARRVGRLVGGRWSA